MKLTAFDILRISNRPVGGVFNGMTVIRCEDTVDDGVVRTVILESDGKLYSCYVARSHDDHGNESVYISSGTTDVSVEIYDGDYVDGERITEIELQEVVKVVEVVEIIKYVRAE